MNKPYVRHKDDCGNLIELGPKENYLTEFPSQNRKARREVKQKHRFRGNNKGWNLSVGNSYKYARVIQHEFNKEGKPKQIEHNILLN